MDFTSFWNNSVDYGTKAALYLQWNGGNGPNGDGKNVFPFNSFDPPANAGQLYDSYAQQNPGSVNFTQGGVQYKMAGQPGDVDATTPGAVLGPGGRYYAPSDYLDQRAAATNGGFWDGAGPFLLALAGAGGVIGGGLSGLAGAAESGAAVPGIEATGGSLGGAGGLLGGYEPYALTGPLTTGTEGGLISGAAADAGSLAGPMTTAGLASPYLGAPFQQGFNYLDPSTYGGAPGGNFGLPPGSSTIAQQIAKALGIGGAASGVTGAGGGGTGSGAAAGGNLGSLAGIGTGLYDLLFGGNKVDPAKLNTLWQAGLNTYNTALDPQQALYGRTVQQLQDQTRAGQSARGTAMSPFGAAGEADVMKNFNIDWNNQALNRQLSGLEGLTSASGGYFRQNNIDQATRNAQIQSGTNALLTGLNSASAPGGWLNTLWNPQSQTPAPGTTMPDFSTNYFGSANPAPNAASFSNPNFNVFDQNTYYGGVAA